jgi:glutamate-ammonia-ligase adenylyltransferase
MDRMDFPPEPLRERILPLVEEIVLGPSIPDVEGFLGAAGIHADAAMAAQFTRICKDLGGNRDSHEKLAVVLAALLESADPAGALVNFARYAETVGVSGTFLNTLAEAKPLRDILATVFGASRYMSDIIVRNPGYLYWLVDQATWESQETVRDYEGALRSDTALFATAEGKLDAVRRFQRRALLKIGAKDLLGARDVEATAGSLSDLAEAITRVALEILWREGPESAPPGDREERGRARTREMGRGGGRETGTGGGVSGEPRADRGGDGDAESCGLAVFALGKLGGRELNYSSDIDLVYVCRDGDDQSIEFYHDLATRLTNALSSVTSEGYLYRTDLRLRPDGASGPLVNSLTAMRIYYESRGRPWEFQAMLKARVIAGDRRVGEEFLGYISGLLLNPSVYGSPIEEIASMRKRIRENIPDREKAFNIKLMEGGIRDIEFIVQTLQLLHGSEVGGLRVPNTMEGLRKAYATRLIKKKEMETMTRAYLFFRLVEHRLQMMHQLRTHSIPESRAEVELLARRVSNGPLGRYTYDSFLSALALHLNQIRLLSESFFAGHGMPEAALLTLVPGDEESAADVLREYSFGDTKRALSVLRSLAYGSFPRLVDRATRTSFQKLLPLLLEDCKATGDPDLTLVNFARLSEASRSERGLYDVLSASPTARLIVRNLTGMSSVLTARLCKHPDILDLLLEDPEFTLVAPLPPLASLARFAEASSGPSGVGGPVVEDLQRDLAAFFDRRLLAAWIIDDASASFPLTMSKAITATVREMISTVLESVSGEDTGMALCALGSFAVGEPRIESDADLLVVAGGRDIERVTRHVYALSRVFSDGGIVKIDFRLRGEGANAPLVQDIAYYRRYFETRMSPWEHVAFAKCARWWGDAAVADAFFDALGAAIFIPMTRERAEALIDMRRRLEGLVPNGAGTFETKRSAGGRYDIEYLTAIALARAGARYPLHANTRERLEMLVSAGALSKADESLLAGAWEVFHKIDFLLELQGFSLPNTPEKEKKIAAYLDRTFDCLGTPVEGGVVGHLGEFKQRVRECYGRVVGLSGKALLDSGSAPEGR